MSNWKNILLSITVFLFLVICAEVGTRILVYWKYGKQNLGFHWKFTYEPFVGTKTHVVKTTRPPKGEKYRIVIIGGSTAAQIHHSTVQEAFQKVIDKEVEVINLAQGGFILNQERITLMLSGIKLDPDLIISINGINDIVSATKTLKPGIPYQIQWIELAVNRPFLNAIFGILKHSQFVNSINKLNERKIERNAQNNSELVDATLNHYIDGIHSISVVANGLGASYIAVLQPYLHLRNSITEKEKTLSPNYLYRKDFMIDMYQGMDELLLSHPFDEHVYYVDGTKAYDSSNEECFIDECHLTKTGKNVLIEYILDAAQKDGFLQDISEKQIIQ